jgi:hypothetical protein
VPFVAVTTYDTFVTFLKVTFSIRLFTETASPVGFAGTLLMADGNEDNSEVEPRYVTRTVGDEKVNPDALMRTSLSSMEIDCVMSPESAPASRT